MENKKYYLTLLVIALVTIAAVLGVYYWSVSPAGNDTKGVVLQSGNAVDDFGVKTPSEQLEYIKKDQKINVLPITSEQEITKETLPQSLNFFILPQVENLKISSVRYADSKEGFKIEYLTSNSLKEAYNNLLPLKGSEWNFVFGGHTDEVGVRNVDSLYYNISTEFIISTDTGTIKTSVVNYVIKK